jgi:tetratricopeptide (TPR) repeat protein
MVKRGDAEIRGPAQLEWLHRLEALREECRAALQWAIDTGQTEPALALAHHLDWFWFVRGDHNEGRHWLGRVLAMPEATRFPEGLSEVLAQLAHHLWLQSGAEEARPCAERALALARASGSPRATARALAVIGLVLISEGHYGAAQSALEERRGLVQAAGDTWGAAQTVLSLALRAYRQDDHPEASRLHEQALALYRAVGDRYFQSAALRFIGNSRVKQGQLAGGLVALREALVLAQSLESKWEIAAVLWSVGDAEHRAGHYRRAARLLRAARQAFVSIGAWTETDQQEYERYLAACRAALAGAEFTAIMEAHPALTLEQAIADVLEGQSD